MIRRSVFLAALFLIALGGASGPGAPGAWTVVRDGSTIDLSLRAPGGERRGRFEEWHGDLTFDPDAPGRYVPPARRRGVQAAGTAARRGGGAASAAP